MAYIKRTWTEATEQMNPTVWKMFHEVKEEAKRLYPQYFEEYHGNPIEPVLCYTNSTHALGSCWCEPRGKIYGRPFHERRNQKIIICLSRHVLPDLEETRNVLVHEFGHAVAPEEHHSYLWKARADKIGQKWGIENSRTNGKCQVFNEAGRKKKEDLKARASYQLFCPKCNVALGKPYVTMCDRIKYPHFRYHTKCKTNCIAIKWLPNGEYTKLNTKN